MDDTNKPDTHTVPQPQPDPPKPSPEPDEQVLPPIEILPPGKG